jgi:2-oxoglutarate ferredoxin oxidoreductase subunit alpha
MGDEAVGHLRERMDIGPRTQIVNRRKKNLAAPFGTEAEDGVPPMPAFGEGESITVTGSTHDEFGVRKTDDPVVQSKLVNRLNKKILNNREKIIQSESYYLDDADLIVIAYGFTARSAFFAVDQLRKQGKKVGLFRLKTIWPFADHLIKALGARGKKLFVPEMNTGQIFGEIQKNTCCDVIAYHQTDGRIIHPRDIMDQIERII